MLKEMFVFRVIVMLFSLLLCSCTSIGFVNEAGSVTIKREKPFCDIKQVDPNCKIEKS